MAIVLSDLYEETGKKYELQLIAGENGLNRELNWVYVAEDQTNSGFLRKGELIISTGALYDHSEDWLLRFVRILWDRHTCGLILNIGKHLFAKDISRDVISFCNSHAFPLFTMPWHIHIYDITRDYYDRLFLDSRNKEKIDFFKLLSAISSTSVTERFVEKKLGAVLEYDRKHSTGFADLMFLYLKHWGNIQAVAAESYCHRNTVTNRIRFLQEQLDYHLNDPDERFELMAAFMVREFNKQQKTT